MYEMRFKDICIDCGAEAEVHKCTCCRMPLCQSCFRDAVFLKRGEFCSQCPESDELCCLEYRALVEDASVLIGHEGVRFFRGVLIAVFIAIPIWIAVIIIVLR